MDEFNNNNTENNSESEHSFAESEYHYVPQNDNPDGPLFKSSESENKFENSYYTENKYGKEFVESVESNKNSSKAKKKFGLQAVVLCSVISALIAAIIAASLSSVIISGKINDLKNTGSGNTVVKNENTNSSQTTTNIEITGVTESVIEAVAQKVTPSVVGIATTEATTSFFGGSTETTGEGSGIVYTSDGYIITNYHVIKSAVTSSKSSIKVYLDSSTETGYDATVVGYNISYDLAVIKIGVTGLTPIDFANSDDLKVGQYVAAIGNPGGLQFMGSVTYGVISGLNRVISDSSTQTDIQLIQTDAAINPGNSGGALANTKGELIGVNSSKIAATDYEGMGFAIPSNTVKEISDNIIAKENNPDPYIGITISERYTANTLTQLGYPAGAVVKSVVSGGPAEKAGISSGDIIVEYNSVAITEYNVLIDAISDSKPGDTVTVKIYRSGRYYSTSLKVGSNNSQ